MRYLYRFFNLKSQAIGAGGVEKVEGHRVRNLEVGEFVKGHIDFRSHLFGIGKMVGLHLE